MNSLNAALIHGDTAGQPSAGCLQGASRLMSAASYLLLVTAMLHLLAHFMGPPAAANEDERRLLELANSVTFNAGGVQRTLRMILSGYSLFFALALVMHGTLNLMLLRYCRRDALVLRAVGWVGVLSMTGYLVISVCYFPLLPAILFGLCLLLFAAALRKSIGAGA